MDIRIYFLSLLLIFFHVSDSKEIGLRDSQINDEFEIKRGTNISHWLSQSKRRGQERLEFFTENDVKFLADLGFDHIRIPIDEEQMWKESGEIDSEAFTLLHHSIKWSEEYGLKVIVDLHILRSHYFNADVKPLWTEASAQERFFQCWRDLSEELKWYPVSMLAYELMNEPVADDPEDWNKLVARAVEEIRKNEPDRKIVIGSNRWQNADTFDELKVPENDPNIILSFHMYEPMLLTHYQASWTSTKDYSGPVNYPGQIVRHEDLNNLEEPLASIMARQQKYYDKASIEKHFEKPIRIAKKYNLPLYCGEWGAYPTTPEKARYQWYEDVRDVLEKNNIAWTTWDYKGGFGIVRNGEEDRELIKVLLK
ncbi:glycoside hydrolase family 5 protein [Aquiflexum sp.]|uniref:glycoside hydrolase family 5 protein n=1 Tax=Aquiflexum sp. TaxID=1872584 RepID=UPI003593E7FD